MNKEFEKIQTHFRKNHPGNKVEMFHLYPGIELFYLFLKADSFSDEHSAMGHIILVNYCKKGQLTWKMENGNHIYLNPGDLSLHTMSACAGSVMTFPQNIYEGLMLCIDLSIISGDSLSILADTDNIHALLYEKFCENDKITSLAGNKQTEEIFSALYNLPERLKLPYQKIKVMELLIYLCNMKLTPHNQLTEYQSEQVAVIREIHEYLLHNIEKRITIEELSKQYLINPTTLKEAFKSVYGTSIAAHIKEHRIKQAADMLRETDLSISEIAQKVGYSSQSKFTTAFKIYFQMLPKEYRRKETYQHLEGNDTCGI